VAAKRSPVRARYPPLLLLEFFLAESRAFLIPSDGRQCGVSRVAKTVRYRFGVLARRHAPCRGSRIPSLDPPRYRLGQHQRSQRGNPSRRDNLPVFCKRVPVAFSCSDDKQRLSLPASLGKKARHSSRELCRGVSKNA